MRSARPTHIQNWGGSPARHHAGDRGANHLGCERVARLLQLQHCSPDVNNRAIKTEQRRAIRVGSNPSKPKHLQRCCCSAQHDPPLHNARSYEDLGSGSCCFERWQIAAIHDLGCQESVFTYQSNSALIGRARAMKHLKMKEDAVKEWTNAKLCDVANLALGAFLFASPWIFGFAAGAPTQNALLGGAAIAILSIAALAAFAVWEEWLNLIVGAWVLVSPWLLGFAGTTATTVHVVIGAVVAVLAAIELWFRHQNPPQQLVGR
jgi:hypothetical protein